MIITELIDYLTVVAKKNPNLVMYSKSNNREFNKINPKYFQIGHIQRGRYYPEVINACEPEDASDFLIQ